MPKGVSIPHDHNWFFVELLIFQLMHKIYVSSLKVILHFTNDFFLHDG